MGKGRFSNSILWGVFLDSMEHLNLSIHLIKQQKSNIMLLWKYIKILPVVLESIHVVLHPLAGTHG